MSPSAAGLVTRPGAPAVDRVARLGFPTHGVVVIAIGALGPRLVLGRGGATTGPEGASVRLCRQPFRRAALAVLVAEVFRHAVRKWVQAFLDPERQGTGVVAVLERVGFGLTGLGYAFLGWAGLRLLTGTGRGGGPEVDDLAAHALSAHFGPGAVAPAGLVVVAAGTFRPRLALTTGFRHILDRGAASAESRAVVSVGRIGHAALAVLSTLIGYFLFRVAFYVDPGHVGGRPGRRAPLPGRPRERPLVARRGGRRHRGLRAVSSPAGP
ncbi:MAG TPA: hypothetical protein VNK43_08875 [Gemmatimonadales bacterium]|nr:hypothetical protein [Gemmatimonadales bacterium]